MKKLISIILLSAVFTLSYSWDRINEATLSETNPIIRGPVVTPDPIGRPTLAPVTAEEYIQSPGYYSGYYHEYRPVSGVISGTARAAEGAVEGAAVAAEGVVEGTAQAVNALIP